MTRITITVKRVRSLLKFLRHGRGLEKHRGGLEVILGTASGNPPPPFGTLPLQHGDQTVSIDVPPDLYERRLLVYGSEPNHGDLLFRLDTSVMFSEDGEWTTSWSYVRRDPIRKIRKLTIAVVTDWTDLLRRMQQELEAENEDNSALIATLERLNLRSFDRSFWHDIFTVPSPSWTSNNLLEIVNCDHIKPSLTLRPDRIEANLDMRKPGGGRFGRAKFDVVFNPVIAETSISQRKTDGQSTWQFLRNWEHAPLEIDFSRPGLNAVTSSNQTALTEIFNQRFSESSVQLMNEELAANEDAILEVWPTLRQIAPQFRRPLLPDTLSLYAASPAMRVRHKINHPAAADAWSDRSCLRPRLTSAFGILATNPPLPIPRSR